MNPLPHGFVDFKIAPYESLPIGTVIENKAAIYFDFNEPIITNTVFHTIFEPLLQLAIPGGLTSTEEKIDDEAIIFQPNPMGAFSELKLKTQGPLNHQVELFDLQGRLILSELVSKDVYRIDRTVVNSGLYFYRVYSSGQLLGSGRLVVK